MVSDRANPCLTKRMIPKFKLLGSISFFYTNIKLLQNLQVSTSML